MVQATEYLVERGKARDSSARGKNRVPRVEWPEPSGGKIRGFLQPMPRAVSKEVP